MSEKRTYCDSVASVATALYRNYTDLVRGGQVRESEQVQRFCRGIASYLSGTATIPDSIMIAGGVGSGKTTMLRAIFNTLFEDAMIDLKTGKEKETPNLLFAKFITARELWMQAKENKGAIDPLFWQSPMLLLIDDVGAEEARLVDFGTIVKPLESVLSLRADAKLPTIITTNLSLKQIGSYYDSARLADRLNLFALLTINFKSFRKYIK